MATTKNKKIKILLVDDHAVLRKGMIALLADEKDIAIVGEAGDGEEAITQVRATKPDVVIMDISMPGLNGIEATRQIVSEFPRCKVIALSIHSSKRFVDDMLGAGAVGYMLKESVSDELLQGIKAVMRGDMYLSGSITGTVVGAYVERMAAGDAGENANVIPLFLTKLHRPEPPRDLVPRQHLLTLLDAGRTRSMTLVSGPAGYGKSTLISCWLETSEWPSAWLSLDESDSDLRQFLNYVLAAIQSEGPDVCQKMQDLINAPQLPSSPMLAACLSNDLEALEKPLILVLDDYHYIDAESEVNTFLHQFLAHPSASLHLVILSRRDPPLQLVTLRANGHITEIRMQDLRFNAQETRLLLERNTQFRPSDEALKNLEEEMEGWVVGLRLLSLVIHQIEDPETFLKQLSGGVQQTQQYLIQEVLNRQLPHVQDWMLKSAILDRFCAPSCEAVCATTDVENQTVSPKMNGDMFIEELLDSNLFVIPLDSQGEWFRYHHLFQTLLLGELKRRLSSDEVASLHVRASQWYAERHLVEEAMDYALVVGDIEAAVRVVEANRLTALNADQWQRVGKWLERLPQEVMRQHSTLLLAQAWVAMESNRIADIVGIVEQIESLSDDAALEPALLGELNFIRGVSLYFEGQAQRSQEFFDKAYEQLPRNCPMMVGEVQLYRAVARQLNGQSELAISELKRAIRDINPRETMLLSRLLAGLAFVHQMDGELQLLAATARRLQELCTATKDLKYAMSWASYMRAFSYLHAFDLGTAQRSCAMLRDQHYIMHPGAAIDTMVALALSYQLMQRPEDASEAVVKLLEFAAETDASENLHVARSCQARIALLQGDISAATSWLRINQAEPPLPNLLFWIEIPAITQVRVQIALGSDESLLQAAESLQRLKEQTEALNNTCQSIEILALLSVALEKLGRADEALTVLQEVLALAGPRGWVRPFVELGQPMAELLERLGQKHGDTDYLRHILNRFTTTESGVAQVDAEQSELTSDSDIWIGEPLTSREFDILELLAQRLQNKEIATQLHVSPETIKSHLKHLYQKLGVSNRREAGIKAAKIISANS